jgi:hypothetical protein
VRAPLAFAKATEGRRPPKPSRLLAVAAILLAGCVAYERAEITIDPNPARATHVASSPWEEPHKAGRAPRSPGGRWAEARASSPGWGLGSRDRRRGRSAPAGPVRLTLGSSAPTDRAALSLVALALDRVPAVGSVRSIIEGLQYFSHAGDPRFTVHLEHANGRGAETWVIDRAWALRKLDGGAVLVWQGELGPVIRTLSLVIPPRAAARQERPGRSTTAPLVGSRSSRPR